jgi:type I restriction enzyme S subunit
VNRILSRPVRRSFEEYSEEDRGMSANVPNGWIKTSIRELEHVGDIELGRGKIISQKDIAADPGNYPVYSSSAKGNGEFGRYGKFMFDEELVTWSVDGGGKFFYRPKSRYSITNVSGFLRVTAKEKLDTYYTWAHLFDIWQTMTFNYSEKLHPSILRERFSFSYPPLHEQKKIAHILSTVQRAIEAQERIIQTTTELKKALMHKLFTEGLRNEPQKQTEIGPVPESWEVVPLSDVCRFQSGGTPSKKNPEFWKGTIPWVSPKDMKRPRLDDVADHISQEALESGSKLAPAGSVFVVVRGMILAKTVPVALAEVPMAINQDMKAIVPGPKLRSDFLLYALETLRGNLFKKVGRSGHGTATLMGHEVAAFKIPLPDLQTQKEIASAIQNLERKKELHEQKQTQLQDLFRTFLHELMTAKTRVHALTFPAQADNS